MLYRCTLLRNLLLYEDCLDAVGLSCILHNIKKFPRKPKKKRKPNSRSALSVIPFPSIYSSSNCSIKSSRSPSRTERQKSRSPMR